MTTTSQRWDTGLNWENLEPQDRATLTANVEKMWPDTSPRDYWESMEPKTRSEWIWHQRNPIEADNAWEAEQDRIARQIDPATQAALDALEEPQCEPSPEGEFDGLDLGESLEPSRRVVLTPASSITMRPVHWLWEGRLPVGELSLFAGREDIGKSTISYTLVAWITTGTMKGEFLGQPRAVLVAASEDSWEHTIVPRLTAAGADLDLVYRVDVTTAEGMDGWMELPSDILAVEAAAKEVGAVLLLLDPLMSRLSTGLDSHKDAEVRRALEPLVAMGHRINLAILGLIHVNKGNSQDTLTSIMASRAFSAVARSVLFAIKDPEDESRRILGNEKNNLGRSDLPTFNYEIVSDLVADTEEGAVWTGKVNWIGKSDRSISDVLAEAREAERDSMHSGDDPDGWLTDFLTLANGSKASALVKKAGKEAGFSHAALNRAGKRLGLEYRSEGFPRTTVWYLPSCVTALESGTTATTATTGADQGVRTEHPDAVVPVVAVASVVHAPSDSDATGGPLSLDF